jgi:hypothetical protein
LLQLTKPAWEIGRRLNLNNNRAYGTRFWLRKSLEFSDFEIRVPLNGAQMGHAYQQITGPRLKNRGIQGIIGVCGSDRIRSKRSLDRTEDRAIRISGSRVSLESVLHHYKAGATPEQIA